MPKREDETYRNIYPHPPSCNCWECTQKRVKGSGDTSLTGICPICHKKSLFYNSRSGQYECLNLHCRATGRALSEIRRTKYVPRHRIYPTIPRAVKKRTPRRAWNNIPLKVRKLFLNLLVIAGLGLSVWNGYLLFTHQATPVRGTIVFVASVGFLIWIISVLRSRRYKYTKPSFKLIFGAMLGILLVCAFAGIQPMSSFKDRGTSWVAQRWGAISSPPPPPPVTQPPSPAPSPPPPTPPEDKISAVSKAVVYIETEVVGEYYSAGSGMIIDRLGYVLTCNHIVEDVQSPTVILVSGEQHHGTVIGKDELRDLAIIKITASGLNLPIVILGNSDKLEIAEEVIAMGYSLGWNWEGPTVSKGIISAFRYIDSVRCIQTDAAINPGNSGGPLINSEGQVVGIAIAKIVEEGVEGMGFAIPINSAKSFIADVMEKEQAQEESQVEEQALLELEKETFRLINVEREHAGVPPTKWDDELYRLSKAHTQQMADRRELFHTPVGASYGENCWGGRGYYHFSGQELARVIVSSWMSSPLHRAWLLHELLRTSVVSIVVTPDGQYASWTFWTSEAGEGPELVRKIVDEWQRETGGKVPWLEWLKEKGYIKEYTMAKWQG